jgi:hypothetical protein
MMRPMAHNPDLSEAAMKNIGRLGTTVLGIYLIAVGVVPYLPPMGVSMLVSVLAVVAGVLILLGR